VADSLGRRRGNSSIQKEKVVPVSTARVSESPRLEDFAGDLGSPCSWDPNFLYSERRRVTWEALVVRREGNHSLSPAPFNGIDKASNDTRRFFRGALSLRFLPIFSSYGQGTSAWHFLQKEKLGRVV